MDQSFQPSWVTTADLVVLLVLIAVLVVAYSVAHRRPPTCGALPPVRRQRPQSIRKLTFHSRISIGLR
jgi:hypothetical protein